MLDLYKNNINNNNNIISKLQIIKVCIENKSNTYKTVHTLKT